MVDSRRRVASALSEQPRVDTSATAEKVHRGSEEPCSAKQPQRKSDSRLARGQGLVGHNVPKARVLSFQTGLNPTGWAVSGRRPTYALHTPLQVDQGYASQQAARLAHSEQQSQRHAHQARAAIPSLGLELPKGQLRGPTQRAPSRPAHVTLTRYGNLMPSAGTYLLRSSPR